MTLVVPLVVLETDFFNLFPVPACANPCTNFIAQVLGTTTNVTRTPNPLVRIPSGSMCAADPETTLTPTIRCLSSSGRAASARRISATAGSVSTIDPAAPDSGTCC